MTQSKASCLLLASALSAWSVAASAATVGLEQAGGWHTDRNEYKCISVSRTQGMQNSTLYKGDDNYGVYLTFQMGATPGSATSTVKARGSGHPSHAASISFDKQGWDSTTSRSNYAGKVALQGNTAFIDWLSNSSPVFDVHDSELLIGTVTTQGMAQARAILDACQPIVPPANRAATPKSGYQDWLQPADFWSAARRSGTDTIGKIWANLTVNTQGRVDNCVIALSSGFPLVDTQFCNMLEQKGRFAAATDASSKHVPSIYAYKVSKILIAE